MSTPAGCHRSRCNNWPHTRPDSRNTAGSAAYSIDQGRPGPIATAAPTGLRTCLLSDSVLTSIPSCSVVCLQKLGISTTNLVWRNNAYRGDTINGIKRREFGSGISASVDAMARIGYLYLRRGIWEGSRLLPESFIDQARQPVPSVVGLPSSDPINFPMQANIMACSGGTMRMER